jgi:iron(III) transport system permease protein
VSRTRAPAALAAPAVAAVALVVLPLVYLVLRAAGGGLDAFEVLERPGTLTLVGETLMLVAAVTGTAILVGLPLAWLVVRTDLPARRLIAVAAPLPLVIPSYVAALALLGAFGPRGLLQQLLEPLGVERLPEIYGFVGAWLALTLSTYPYVFLLAGAALRGLDPALEDAARGLGRSRWGVFRRVTLPALRPSLGAASLLVALYTLSDFGAVSLMQYNALTRSIYLQYRSLFDRTPAAVLALVLVALAAALLVLEERSRRRVRASASGAERPPKTIPLGAWRWPAFAFCAAVVAFFLVVPLTVLVYWTARGVELGHGIAFAWEAALSSLSASALAAVIAVVAALPVALLAERYPARWTRTLERLGYTGNALPGIVIALSLVFFAALPDARAARVRLRRPVLPAGARRCRVRPAGGAPANRGGSAEPWTRSAARARDGNGAVDPPRIARGRCACLPERDERAPRDVAPAADRLRDARDRDLEVHRARLVLARGAARAPADPRLGAVCLPARREARVRRVGPWVEWPPWRPRDTPSTSTSRRSTSWPSRSANTGR